jgi:uncharacterized Zn finger protein
VLGELAIVDLKHERLLEPDDHRRGSAFGELAQERSPFAHDLLRDVHLLGELRIESGELDAVGQLRRVQRVALAEPQPREQLLRQHDAGGIAEDGDSDAALALAKQQGCPEHQWKEIARAQEEKHPATAAVIYRSLVDPIVGISNNNAYDNGVELILCVRELMRRAGEAPAFSTWVKELRVRHKAKKNFIKRLDDGLGKRQ